MKLFELKNKLDITVDPTDIARLEIIISKKLGIPIYRYGGATGELHIKGTSGVGYLYFYGKHAFRLDLPGSNKVVTHIDYWKDGADAVVNHHPDLQLVLPKDVSLLQIISDVVKFLKHPVAKDIVVKNLNESRVVMEARRTTVEKFITMAKEAIPGKKILSYPELRAVADANDVLIPGGVFDLGLGNGNKNETDTYDLSRVIQDSTGTIINVVSEGAAKIYNYDGIPTLPKSDILELEQAVDEKISAAQLFTDLEDLVKIVIKGTRPSLVVVGGPGVGKTQVIMNTIKDAGIVKGKDYIIVKGKISPLDLYRSLFLNVNKLVIFDDTDSVWDSDDSVQILKGALDSSAVRLVSWGSPLNVNVTRLSDTEKENFNAELYSKLDDDPMAKVKFPSEFNFEGKVIFISNRERSKLDSAVLNRSLSIDMSLTTEQVFERIEQLMDKLAAPNTMELSKETKMEVFDYLKLQIKMGKMKYVSIRTYIGALGVAASGNPNWRGLLKYAGND